MTIEIFSLFNALVMDGSVSESIGIGPASNRFNDLLETWLKGILTMPGLWSHGKAGGKIPNNFRW